MIKRILSYHKICSEDVTLKVDTKTNLVLSYGLTPELYMLEYRAETLLSYGCSKKAIKGSTDKITNGQISNNIYYIFEDWYSSVYEAVYYDPKNNEYYYVSGMETPGNVIPSITAFNTNFVEALYFSFRANDQYFFYYLYR